MAKLDEKYAVKVEELRSRFIELVMKKAYEEAAPLLIEAWDLLPEPKVIYDESFHIATYAVDNYINIKKFQEAKKWSEILFTCNLERHDSGEREYKAGKVAFEMQDLDTAKRYFKIADEKSREEFLK